MKYTMSDIDFRNIDYIYQSYMSGANFIDLSKELDIPVTSMLSLFFSNKWPYERKDCPSFNLNCKKILLMADTHIGSKYENLNYIDLALNYGVKVDVGACLHLGDCIQGKMCDEDKKISTQLKTMEDVFNNFSEYPLYLIGGNHDKNAAEIYDETIDRLAKIFHFMGFKQCFFDWNNYMFVMYHMIKHFEDPMPLDKFALMLMGHGHNAQILTNAKLKAPTASDHIIHPDTGAQPGFMILTMDDNIVSVDLYGFEGNNVVKLKEKFHTKVLTPYHMVNNQMCVEI